MSTRFVVMIYDREDYGGAVATWWSRELPRFLVSADVTIVTKHPEGERVRVRSLWQRECATLDDARACVPAGGAYFDRTGNTPSPMTPLEGWRFSAEPPAPDALQDAAR
jgi:hypothetical protein